MHSHISNHTQNIISGEQHGFIAGRSTVSNLMCKTQFISEAIDQRSQVDVIYTDFSKAFDKIDHNILLRKLESYGFSDALINLFKSYFYNRTQYVQLHGFKSTHIIQASGVPQGSILGPLFFVLFIDDITIKLNVNYLLYADDLKIFSKIDSLDDCLVLQHNLDKINDWCVTNKLHLNANKCNVMSFTRKVQKITFDYELDNAILVRPEFIKDLGVTFDSKLIFNEHIQNITKAAYKSLGFVLRNCKEFLNINTFRLLYITYVRSKLEYASLVWNPIYNIHTVALEKVQRRFMKSAIYFSDNTYVPRGTANEILQQRLNLHSLSSRRITNSIIFLHKILHNSIKSEELLSKINLRVPSFNSRNHHIFHLPSARTNIMVASPLYQMINNYNIESSLDIFACSISQIKRYCFN